MITKATHYGIFHNFEDNSIAKYRLFELTDNSRPNKLILSTDSAERFKIQLDLLGLQEMKNLREEGDISLTYYH